MSAKVSMTLTDIDIERANNADQRLQTKAKAETMSIGLALLDFVTEAIEKDPRVELFLAVRQPDGTLTDINTVKMAELEQMRLRFQGLKSN